MRLWSQIPLSFHVVVAVALGLLCTQLLQPPLLPHLPHTTLPVAQQPITDGVLEHEILKAQAKQRVLQLMSRFVPNVGQWDNSEVLYRFNDHRGLRAGITRCGVVFVLGHGNETEVVEQHYTGCKEEEVAVHTEERLTGDVHYLIGSQHHTNIPTYNAVVQHNVYKGVHVVYRVGAGGRLKREFVMHEESNASQIWITSPHRQEVARSGSVVQALEYGELRESVPVGLCESEDGAVAEDNIPVSASVKCIGELCGIGYMSGKCSRGEALVIDPELLYSTYLGGSGVDGDSIDGDVPSMSLDSAGNIVVVGYTESSDFPTAATPFQSAFGGDGDAFVSKLSSDGSSLVWSSYLGGSGEDRALGVTLDSAGNIVVVGITISSNFPTAGTPFQSTFGGDGDAFVSKLSSDGSNLVWSSYLGGSGEDRAQRITLDSADNVVVVGQTVSHDFPTAGTPFQSTFGGGGDAFVSKLSNDGSSLVWSSYLGGSGEDMVQEITLDSADNVVVVGQTASRDFPTAGRPFQSTLGGAWDAFASKLSKDGSSLVWSTYLGGSGDDWAYGVTLDGAGKVVVVGQTVSSNFPTTGGPFQSTYGGGAFDAFVSKLSNDGSSLVWSTYLGGSGDDWVYGETLDSSDNVVVMGRTESSNFPTTGTPFQPTLGGKYDIFASTVWQCELGKWYSIGDSTCKKCVKAQICPVGIVTEQYCSPGTWSDQIVESQDECSVCTTAGCIGGDACAKGYIEAECFECDSGYYKVTRNGLKECCACNAVKGWQLAVVILLILVLATAFVVLFQKRFERAQMTLFPLRQSLIYLQMLSLLYMVGKRLWPNAARDTLFRLSFWNIDVDSLAPATRCFLGFQQKTVMILLLPLVFAALMSIFLKVFWYLHLRALVRDESTLSRISRWFGAQDFEACQDTLYMSMWTFLLFSYTPVSNAALQWLDCEKKPSGVMALYDFAAQECYTHEWYMMLFLVVPAIVLYCIGIPVAVFMTLLLNHHDLAAVVSKYGVLFTPYGKDHWYWEVINTLRKLLIIVIMRFLRFDIVMMMSVLFSGLLIAAVVQWRAQPALMMAANRWELVQLGCSGLIAAGGIYFAAQNADGGANLSSSDTFMLVVVMTGIIGIMATVLWSMVQAYRHYEPGMYDATTDYAQDVELKSPKVSLSQAMWLRSTGHWDSTASSNRRSSRASSSSFSSAPMDNGQMAQPLIHSSAEEA